MEAYIQSKRPGNSVTWFQSGKRKRDTDGTSEKPTIAVKDPPRATEDGIMALQRPLGLRDTGRGPQILFKTRNRPEHRSDKSRTNSSLVGAHSIVSKNSAPTPSQRPRLQEDQFKGQQVFFQGSDISAPSSKRYGRDYSDIKTSNKTSEEAVGTLQLDVSLARMIMLPGLTKLNGKQRTMAPSDNLTGSSDVERQPGSDRVSEQFRRDMGPSQARAEAVKLLVANRIDPGSMSESQLGRVCSQNPQYMSKPRLASFMSQTREELIKYIKLYAHNLAQHHARSKSLKAPIEQTPKIFMAYTISEDLSGSKDVNCKRLLMALDDRSRNLELRKSEAMVLGKHCISGSSHASSVTPKRHAGSSDTA